MENCFASTTMSALLITARPTATTSREVGGRTSEALTLALYIVMLASVIPFHQPWVDETQAWQLARSVPISQLFTHYLRYEGTAGLWYLLIKLLSKLHISYMGLHWFCGLIAISSVSQLIFLSPFPRWVRLTLPFTYFLAFQYAVVARSYVLVPILLFTIAVVWRRGSILLALLLGLLANVAMHAFAISAGFALVYMFEVLLGQRTRESAYKRVLAGSLFLLLCGFAVWTVLPHPNDLGFLVPFTPRLPVLQVAVFYPLIGIISLCKGIAIPIYLALPFWVYVVRQFRDARRALYLLPIATLSLLSAYHFQFWHAGLVIPTIIAICWITWDDLPSLRPLSPEIIGTACYIALQIGWTIYMVGHRPHSAAQETARFLAPHVTSGESIALTYTTNDVTNAYPSIELMPYFDHPIFFNQPRPFWLWSTREHTNDQLVEAMKSKPGMVVAIYFDNHRFDVSRDLSGPRIDLLRRDGYKLTQQFCDESPESFGEDHKACYLIFRKPD
jgi:hypothetical protein